MIKLTRFIAATTLAFGSLLFAKPAFASDWQATNANIIDGYLQFDYRGGTASQTLTVPEGATLTITVNNTISNRIGWGAPLPDTWSVSVNGQIYTGNAVEITTLTIPVSGTVELVVGGIDRGYWAGWYGPIFTNPVISAPQPVIEPVSQEVIRPTEEVVRPEPTSEPIAEPVLPPVYENPTPVIPVEPTLEPTPTDDPDPTPEPSTPVIDPIPEVIVPEPTPEPTPEPELPVIEETVPEFILESSPEQLMAEAQADDPVVPTELASIPVLGNVAVAVLDAFNALGNVGADLKPEVREKAQEVVVSSVIVGQIATASMATTSAASYRRNK